MFNSILQSYGKLSDILTEKNKVYIVAGIDLNLLAIVTKFFEKLNRIFDILEFGSIASIQNVAPSYYALQNAWEIETDDDPLTRILKRIMTEELVQKNKQDRIIFIKTAREGIILAFKEKLIPPPQFQIQENQVDEPLLPSAPKSNRLDPLLCFRNFSTTVSTNNYTNWNEENLRSELTDYEKIISIQYDEDIFDPIKWRGEHSCRFPIPSFLSQSFLVIQASSAESERHFSSAGRGTRKDRAKLNPDTVEGLVLLNDALKKKII
ncbi:Zinc finger BED domain-containing protein 1-like [Oopsacas minuta]|uniref:Zinc finger BED domain-containing protein 1-like n=1 Tax=Oopsacas minuta TaxID=111878 RepID=A0AAV7K4B2_9METZ|nr:Zinc finger BED domain-containing protein 1-like [Oopsacas minuta]